MDESIRFFRLLDTITNTKMPPGVECRLSTQLSLRLPIQRRCRHPNAPELNCNGRPSRKGTQKPRQNARTIIQGEESV